MEDNLSDNLEKKYFFESGSKKGKVLGIHNWGR